MRWNCSPFRARMGNTKTTTVTTVLTRCHLYDSKLHHQRITPPAEMGQPVKSRSIETIRARIRRNLKNKRTLWVSDFITKVNGTGTIQEIGLSNNEAEIAAR